jgi:DNA modification methylase
VLREVDTERIHGDPAVTAAGPVDLVVTSPPYPGIHMLYHRWQVDGRKETDAPYWIAAKNDGCGTAFYNFADRRRSAEDRYFEKAERSFRAVRQVMKPGAVMVQLIAFSDPQRQIRRYLSAMERAGFTEARSTGKRRVWRDVPGRRWHANSKGELASSREVMLVHSAT